MIENTLKDDQKIKYFDLATKFQINDKVAIEHRGNLRVPNADNWAITYNSNLCYNNESYKWEEEPMPSNRTDAFIAGTRYSLQRALEIVNSLKFQKYLK